MLVTSKHLEDPWDGYGLVVLRESDVIALAKDVAAAAERFFKQLGEFLEGLKRAPLVVFVHLHPNALLVIPETFEALLKRLGIELCDPGMGPGPLAHVGVETPLVE